MNIKFDLVDVVKDIETKIGQTASKQKRLNDIEYTFASITETQLIDELGFEYKGNSIYTNCPTYQKDNIFAFYNENILHLVQLY